MSIRNVSELEFIGESLPKINGNFTDLNSRAVALENTSTQYSGLSSFYSTHSNNSNINFSTGGSTQEFTNHSYTREQVYKNISFANLTDSQVSKIIFPVPIYVTVINASDNSDVSLEIKITPTSSSSQKTLFNRVISPRATGTNQSDYATQLITFEDLGYHNWSLNFSGAGCRTFLNWTIKYLG